MWYSKGKRWLPFTKEQWISRFSIVVQTVVVPEWSWNLWHSSNSSLSLPIWTWPLDIVWLSRTGKEEGRNVSIILFPSLKPVKCSRKTELLSTNCKINAYCINKFTKMLSVELIHTSDSHSSFPPLGFTSSFVFMEFY